MFDYIAIKEITFKKKKRKGLLVNFRYYSKELTLKEKYNSRETIWNNVLSILALNRELFFNTPTTEFYNELIFLNIEDLKSYASKSLTGIKRIHIHSLQTIGTAYILTYDLMDKQEPLNRRFTTSKALDAMDAYYFNNCVMSTDFDSTTKGWKWCLNNTE